VRGLFLRVAQATTTHTGCGARMPGSRRRVAGDAAMVAAAR